MNVTWLVKLFRRFDWMEIVRRSILSRRTLLTIRRAGGAGRHEWFCVLSGRMWFCCSYCFSVWSQLSQIKDVIEPVWLIYISCFSVANFHIKLDTYPYTSACGQSNILCSNWCKCNEMQQVNSYTVLSFGRQNSILLKCIAPLSHQNYASWKFCYSTTVLLSF